MNITSFIESVCVYICSKWKIIATVTLVIFLLFIVISFFLWVGISYYILKWFRRNIDDNFYYENYTSKCRKYMKIYGDLPIKKIYFVRRPVEKYVISLIRFIHDFNNPEKGLYELYMKEHPGFYPKHSYIVIEVELPNKFIKHIKIEKTNCIDITLNYNKHESHEMIKINCKKNKYTINKILDKTQKRVKSVKYFNWHLCKNNCRDFAFELLKSIGTKNEQYFDDEEADFFSKMEFTDLKLHIINCIINSYSILREFLY